MAHQAETLDQIRDVLRGAGPLDHPELLRAVAATCYLMASADGEVTEDEHGRIAATLAAISGGGAERAAIQEIIAAVALDAGERGQEAVLSSVARDLASPEQRRRALAWAAGVAFADGVLDFEEEVLFLELADAFALPRDEAQAILDRFAARFGG